MKLIRQDAIERLPTSDGVYQTFESVAISEPRLLMIERRLSELLRVVQLESHGKPIEVSGFRLRDPANWTAPAASVFSELWHISSACNMRCPFCYEEGDPPGSSAINEPAAMASLGEIETRLKYRDRRKGTGLFQPLTYINEIFCNPRAMEIIERVRREEPTEVLTFVTNGTYLTEDVVAQLAKLKPLYFNFSVNSLDPVVRERVLRDRNPAVAIEALELLRRFEIPYLGSLVCWPTIPWSDIEATVRGLDAAGCAMIRFSLSAYSKHLKGRRFERKSFWDKGVEIAQRLAAEIRTPIKIEPYHYADPTNRANIVGTIVGSPAARADIRPGDRIVAIDGRPVPSVNHALSTIAHGAVDRCINLEIETGNGLRRTVTLRENDAEDRYPYQALAGFPGFQFGLLLVENLQYAHLKMVADIIQERGAKRVLLLSSELMRPIVTQMIAETKLFGSREVFVEVPQNRFFGGTVVLGDLLVVEDYVAFIKDFQAHPDRKVDLVIIPSSPFSRSGWMRDLTGRPATDIERATGVPVEFVECRPLNG